LIGAPDIRWRNGYGAEPLGRQRLQVVVAELFQNTLLPDPANQPIL